MTDHEEFETQETKLESLLRDIMEEAINEGSALDITRVRSYNETGLMTQNRGLVLRMSDGSEYQLTIVKSR